MKGGAGELKAKSTKERDAYASGVCASALVAKGALAGDGAVDVGVVVRGDVTCAATAMGGDMFLVRHYCAYRDFLGGVEGKSMR